MLKVPIFYLYYQLLLTVVHNSYTKAENLINSSQNNVNTCKLLFDFGGGIS